MKKTAHYDAKGYSEKGWIRGFLSCLLVLCLTGISQWANAQEEEDDEVFELSPFEVSGATSGYYATETLSGTYLRTNMRSLANPVTVMTQEFMEDIGATSYEDVVNYLPSSGTYEGDTSDFDANSARTGTPYNARGFRVTQLTQNFLATNIRQDNFNTERLTQSRGPNSLLFGLGSVGGAMDITVKRGEFGADFANVEFQFDEYESRRFAFDYNKELVDSKLALRLALLHDDARTFRDLQFRRRNSAYGNLTYRPFEGTTIHFMGEAGDIDELNPRLYLTKDAFTPYVNSPLSDLEKANLTDIDIIVNGNNTTRGAARNVINSVTRGFATNNELIYIMNAPELGVMNWKWKSQGDQPWINGIRVNNVSIVDPQLTPEIYYPLDTVPAGPQDQYNTDYQKYGFDLQQRLLKNTYFQFTYQFEDREVYDFRPVARQEWFINIDTNYYLPHQSAADNPNPSQPLNPYYGVPYIEGSAEKFETSNDLTQYRANLTHEIDLSGIEPLKGFDLGQIRLVGSYYYLEDDFQLTRQDEMTGISLFSNGRLDDTQGWIYRRYYLSANEPKYFPGIPWEPINQAADPSVIGNIRPAVQSAWLNRLNPIWTISETESLSALGQWSMFRDRLILTGGWREDELTDKVMDFVRDPVTRIWEEFDTGTFGDASSNKVDNHNYGVVVRPLQWIDIFYNESTNNVNAGVTAFDVYNDPIPDQTGEGNDYGARLFLLDDRVIVKLNYYENELQNKIANPLRDGAAVGIGMARENGRVEDLLDALDYNGRSDLYGDALHFDEYPGNGLWTDVENTSSEGYELEITANLTRNWRVLFNFSKQETIVNATYVTFMPWYDQYVAPIKGDPSITSLPADPDDSATETIGDIIADIDRKLLFHTSQVGGQQVRSNRLGWNLVTSYEFNDTSYSWLENVRVGLGTRWREAPAIGYQEDAEGNFLTDKPFYGEDEFITDVFVSKSWRVGSGKDAYRVNATFRVRNVFEEHQYVPRTGVDDGTGTVQPLQQVFVLPRTYEFTVNLRF